MWWFRLMLCYLWNRCEYPQNRKALHSPCTRNVACHNICLGLSKGNRQPEVPLPDCAVLLLVVAIIPTKLRAAATKTGRCAVNGKSSLCCAWNPRFLCKKRGALLIPGSTYHAATSLLTSSHSIPTWSLTLPLRSFFGGWWDVFSSFHWTLLRTGHLNPEMARPAEGATRLSWHHGIPVVMDIKIVY